MKKYSISVVSDATGYREKQIKGYFEGKVKESYKGGLDIEQILRYLKWAKTHSRKERNKKNKNDVDELKAILIQIGAVKEEAS